MFAVVLREMDYAWAAPDEVVASEEVTTLVGSYTRKSVALCEPDNKYVAREDNGAGGIMGALWTGAGEKKRVCEP
jgi:hypothetical protein